MPDQIDYTQAVSDYLTSTRSATVAGAQANPDEAARNVQLEQATGVPSKIIGLDQEGFEQRHKETLASQIVADNPYLQAYVLSHPMAASVSNDDWGALSEFSDAAHSTSQFLESLNAPIARVAEAGAKGAVSGAEEGFGGVPEFYPQATAAGNLVQSASVLAQLGLKGGSAFVSAMSQGIGEAARATAEEFGATDVGKKLAAEAEKLGWPTANAESFGRSIAELVEWHMISPGGAWQTAHQEVPRGVNAEVDAAKAEANAHGLEKIEGDLKAAQASATKERAPELFRQLVRQHYGNTTIGIHGDRVAQLYGDKPPAPDDNLLGWVQGMGNKLDLARETGADVEVPLADWIAKVDPKLHEELRDDLRIWPGGITAREAGEAKPPEGEDIPKEAVQAAPTEYPQFIDAPLAQVRGAAGLEPMFMIGDRKLSLTRTLEDVLPGLDAAGNIVARPYHMYDILDENGQPVGEMQVSVEGNKLRVEYIQGTAGMWANDFGPSLIMDLKRQLRELYPGAETIGGARVSGAAPGREVSVNLAAPAGWDVIDGTRRIFADAYRPVDAGVEANIQPSAMFLAHEKELAGAVHDELAKITGGRAQVVPSAGIRYREAYPTGMFFGRSSLIVYDLLGRDPVGVARHESIHFLRDQGLFTDREWETLSQASKEEKWGDFYNINERYDQLYAGRPNLEEMKIEESVAEAFRDWMGQKEEARRQYSPVARIFEKLRQFLGGLSQRIAEIFGHVPTADELFQKISTGEVGQRALQGTRGEGPLFSAERGPEEGEVYKPEEVGGLGIPKSGAYAAFRWKGRIWTGLEHRYALENAIKDLGLEVKKEINKTVTQEDFGAMYGDGVYQPGGTTDPDLEHIPDAPRAPEPRSAEPLFSVDDLNNLKASSLGLDRKAFDRIQKLVHERYAKDVEASIRVAEREQARRQSKEWKDNKETMATEVEATIRQRPDVAADLFIGSGEYNGEKLQQRFTLRAGDLTAEQKEGLPAHYVSTHGLPIDDVARLFGYQSGDTMVQHLAEYNALKGGRSPQEMLRHVIDTEADRQMELKYGNLHENILQEAQDRALAENELHILSEEYRVAAEMAGVTAVGKEEVAARAKDLVSEIPLNEIDFRKQMLKIGDAYRDAVRTLIKGDPASAVQHLQRRTLSAFVAAEMKRIEKLKAQTDRLFKTLKGLPKASGKPTRAPEYLNYEHQIMNQVGVTTRRRSPESIQKDIDARGTGTLQEFAQDRVNALRVMPVWDQLFDQSWRKPYEQLTAGEFESLHKTMKAMDFNAREELKITRQHEAETFDEVKDKLIASVQRFKEKAYDTKGRRVGFFPTIFRVPRTFLAHNTQLENLLNYWDGFDKWGDWNQSFMRGLIEGANQADRWVKDYAKELEKLDDKTDLSKSVENPLFRSPLKKGGFGELESFNRENLRRILLDAGNPSNLVKRAKGYGLEPDQVMAWLHTYATKGDWDWGQGIWDMWASIKEKGDTMFRSMTGEVAPDDIRLRPIVTKFGTYKGGYFPANDWHPLFEGTSSKLSGKDSLMQKGFVSATAMPGWTQTRTGYAAPLRNDLDNLANLMKQHLHDIAMRPAIVNAAKIVGDHEIMNAIKLHIGKEHADMFMPYLKALANRTDYMSTHQAYADGYAEQLRRNLVTTLVGLNIGTVLKHAPTALVMSIKEVGPKYYLKGVRAMYSINEATGDSNKKFVDDNSLEVNRRSRNWQETLYGQMAAQTPGNKLESLQQEVQRLSSQPVAFSDMMSARPTWLGEYFKTIEGGRPHGDAVYAADRAVRRAHGSTSPAIRPQMMRDANPWLTSVYNFFNDILNRQLETLWRAGEMRRDAKANGWASASKAIPGIAAGIFAYAIWPAIVEQLVSPGKSDPNESWTKKILKGLAHTESATLPIVRDVAQYLVEGSEASLGLVGTGMKELGHAIGDFSKKNTFSPLHAERMIHDWAGLAGMLTGMVPQAVDNIGSFGYGLAADVEHPQSPWDWLNGVRYGTARPRRR